MLITCPECSHTVSDKAVFCPECGYPIQEMKKKEAPASGLPTADSSPVKPKAAPRKKRRHKKLPNGFGSIKYLGKNRHRPYAAYPPTTQYHDNGSPVTVPAIGYYEDWYEAFDALRAYSANPYDIKAADLTFADIYRRYYTAKYENSKKQFSLAAQQSTAAAYKNCSPLHNRRFMEIRKADLQAVVDGCPLKHASLELIINLFHGMYRYAMENDITDKDYSRFVSINIPDDDEKGEPFSQEEIDILWKNRELPGVDAILIMIYSGFRISAYRNVEINLEERYFKGGVKTSAGKNRIVPIHDSIYEMVAAYQGKPFMTSTAGTFRAKTFQPALEALGIQTTAGGKKHTPHDCRHTFSWLCDRYGVDDLSKHLLMGHAVRGDVERAVYGHRTLEQLRVEINKIQA